MGTVFNLVAAGYFAGNYCPGNQASAALLRALSNDRTQAQPPAQGVDCRTGIEDPFALPMPHAVAGWLLPEVNGWVISSSSINSSYQSHPDRKAVNQG
jgi:hypothetical protein